LGVLQEAWNGSPFRMRISRGDAMALPQAVHFTAPRGSSPAAVTAPSRGVVGPATRFGGMPWWFRDG
jgi:hypothetical protein